MTDAQSDAVSSTSAPAAGCSWLGRTSFSCRFTMWRRSLGQRPRRRASCIACMSASRLCRTALGNTASPVTSSSNTWRRAPVIASGWDKLRRGEGRGEQLLRHHRGGVVENLERFRGNATLTAVFGAAARETAETSFSLQATLPRIAELLQEAATLRPSARRTPSRTALRSGLARSAGSSGAAPSQ